jgi:hypothetical protein
MFAILRRRTKYYVVALLLVAVVGIMLIRPALAVVWFPTPPSCHRDARWLQWKPGAWALYEFAYEYRGRRLYGPCQIRGQYPYERVYVYNVQNVFYPYGLVTVGRAEKVCGTTGCS